VEALAAIDRGELRKSGKWQRRRSSQGWAQLYIMATSTREQPFFFIKKTISSFSFCVWVFFKKIIFYLMAYSNDGGIKYKVRQ
jgi:hypothetical protein